MFGLCQVGLAKGRGLLLLAQMSSQGALATGASFHGRMPILHVHCPFASEKIVLAGQLFPS